MFFNEDIYSKVLLLIIAQTLFLGIILLLKPKKKGIAAYILGTLFIIHSFEVFYFYLLQTGYLIFYPDILPFNYAVKYIIGPMIYFLVKSITDKNWKFRKISLLHFAIFFFAVGYYFEFLFQPEMQKTVSLTNSILNFRAGKTLFDNYTALDYFINFLYRLQPMIYLVLSVSIIFNKKNNSGLNTVQRVGYKTLTMYYLVVYILGYILQLTVSNEIYSKLHVILACLMGLLFLVISYIIYSYPESLRKADDKKKYMRTKLNREKTEEYKTILSDFIAKSNLIFENNITLPQFSKMVGIPQRELSQLINENYKMNFNEFINDHRLCKAKNILLSDESDIVTIEGIAADVGFKSRASFYRAFKNKFGITPAEYKNKHK